MSALIVVLITGFNTITPNIIIRAGIYSCMACTVGASLLSIAESTIITIYRRSRTGTITIAATIAGLCTGTRIIIPDRACTEVRGATLCTTGLAWQFLVACGGRSTCTLAVTLFIGPACFIECPINIYARRAIADMNASFGCVGQFVHLPWATRRAVNARVIVRVPVSSVTSAVRYQ